MLNDKKVAILIASKFHEEETTGPRDYIAGLGARVDLVGLDSFTVTGKYGHFSLTPDKTIHEVKPGDYDAIVLPGGGAPERIRIDETAIKFVQDFWKTGRPVAAICHGPQVLISANVLKGVELTCYEGIRDDVKNAGAVYVDKPVCIDGQLITSRTPKDLTAFNETLAKALSTGFLDKDEAGLDVLKALELAISRENGAREFYWGVSEIVQTEKMKNKFIYLATVEVEHFEQLSKLYVSLSGGAQPEIQYNKNEIGKHKVDQGISGEQAVDLAIEAEQKAYDFYRNAALKARNDKVKEMFEYLATEELEHKRLLLLDISISPGGAGHFQWATHFDIPPGMDDLW